MTSLPAVLFFSFPEHGQTNVILATSYQLALAGVNVYISSFAPFRSRVSRLQELVNRHASDKLTGSVIFCDCKGEHSIDPTNLPHPPGVSGALKSFLETPTVFFPWSIDEYVAIMESCKEIITATRPNLVVIDAMFCPALDACELLNQKFIHISPNSIKDLAVNLQPSLAVFWKYPVLSSGFPYPLKWWQALLNIYLYIRLIIILTSSAKMREMRNFRKSLGLGYLMNGQPYRGVTCICPALTEIDFPFAVIPKELRLCGPIVLPFQPLEDSDPALQKWLDKAPTVLINLGTHVISDEKHAREMAGSIRILLDHHDRRGLSMFQVLWKVRANGGVQTVIDETIGKEIKQGRVKVLPWLEVEPVSVLQHPNVVCTVHHGGANSFYEGIWSGVPHIVLPVWYDTYDFAARAEFLNVGICGNKSFAPGVRADEFGDALVRVTGSEEAIKFRTSAERLKNVCRAKGNGSELSCAVILEELGIKK